MGEALKCSRSEKEDTTRCKPVVLYKAIDVAGPTMAVLVVISYPVISTIASTVFLKEALSLQQVIGGGIILFSVYRIVKG